MLSIQHIQKLPEEKREQILWATVGATLLLLVLLWIVTSKLPHKHQRPQDFFTALHNRVNQASANFPK
jgi:hypothetical protein